MSTEQDFEGFKVLVTGATRGIGREIALKLASLGADIAVLGKSKDPHPTLSGTLDSVCDEVTALGRKALPLHCDVRDESQIKASLEEIQKTFGGLNILVNNAGYIRLTRTQNTEPKSANLMLDINLRAPLLFTTHALPLMKAGGHILNMSPPLTHSAKWLGLYGPYSTSKYGMSMLTIAWSQEFKRIPIHVNSLWPKTLIATAAMGLFPTINLEKDCRQPGIVADAAALILKSTETGNHFLDEEILAKNGITDFSKYQAPGANPKPDLFI